MSHTIRLLIADDHALVRAGLKRLFALTTDIEIAREAGDSSEVIQALEREQFDLILLDMNMPGISGPDLIVKIRRYASPPPILVLSMLNEPLIVRKALAAGAAGYLTKDTDVDILLAAIRKVAGGGLYLDAALAEAMAFESAAPASLPREHKILSKRESLVFSLLAEGVSINDIATRLSISAKTVSTHKARLMRKMGFANNADMVRYAVSHIQFEQS